MRLQLSTTTTLAVLLSTFSTLSSAYTWPSPQYDALEALIYEGRTTAGSSLTALVHPCKKRVGTLASVPAEWLRFAFHDMATHNVDDGTGGMDGSIVYELGRAENFGSGFNQTLGDFENFPNKYLSRADIIAAGAVHSVATCGGPIIPFRGGRIDTFEAGGFGTPEPHHDLDTLTESFRRQGFSTPEMIKMVACGHTMGGVRSEEFPQLVPPGPDPSVMVIQDFDTTPDFDNKVVTEYLDGTTPNVLVNSPNRTLVSDLRVFSADGNNTMREIAPEDTFQSECRDILERMLNVVPRGVTLTEEITMLPVKVKNAQLTIEKEQLVFKSTLRLAQPLDEPVSKERVVTMFWCDRYGNNKDCEDSARSSVFVKRLTEDPDISPVTKNLGYSFYSYDFVVPINPAQSISKFWFEVDEKDGSRPTLHNNEGTDYPVEQDEIIFVPMMSSVNVISNGTDGKVVQNRNNLTGEFFYREYNLVVGVREDTEPDRVYVDGFDSSVLGFAYLVNTTIDLTLDDSLKPVAGYKFYTGQLDDSGLQLSIDLNLDVGGRTYRQDFVQTNVLDNTPYVAPGTVMSGDRPSSALALRDGWICSLVALSLSMVAVGYLS
ncbi:cytochrome c peroxidase [Coprinopsis cinerea AmutBmut pab1-1]|nr:cytochrome c peroxidase [Coprinopsis cinerea AmutBmut pab1-1]